MAHSKRKLLPIWHFIGLIGVLALGCSKEPKVSDYTKDYYLDHLGWTGKGKVYIYEPVSDPTLPMERWHYRYSPGYRGNYLHSARFDDDGRVIQRTVERIQDSVSMLLSMDLHIPTDSGAVINITPSVIQNETFHFGKIGMGNPSWSQIEYYDNTGDSVRVILTKSRSNARKVEYNVLGEDCPAIQIDLAETLETETEGFTETSWTGTEIYAEHKGLVYYKKTINADLQLEYVLREIVPFEIFQANYDAIQDTGWEQ